MDARLKANHCQWQYVNGLVLNPSDVTPLLIALQFACFSINHLLSQESDFCDIELELARLLFLKKVSKYLNSCWLFVNWTPSSEQKFDALCITFLSRKCIWKYQQKWPLLCPGLIDYTKWWYSFSREHILTMCDISLQKSDIRCHQMQKWFNATFCSLKEIEHVMSNLFSMLRIIFFRCCCRIPFPVSCAVWILTGLYYIPVLNQQGLTGPHVLDTKISWGCHGNLSLVARWYCHGGQGSSSSSIEVSSVLDCCTVPCTALKAGYACH